jgi:hypothetical protein
MVRRSTVGIGATLAANAAKNSILRVRLRLYVVLDLSRTGDELTKNYSTIDRISPWIDRTFLY